jgi:glycosyltransferase involved in cell wall biosynthesis
LRARGIAESSIRVIPNWADTDEITPRATAGNPIRAELALADKFVVGYSGNLGRAHEFETFLGAAQLLRGDARFAFLITGGGAKLADLRRGVETLGLTSFRFQAYQPPERLAESMAAADAHLVSLKPAVEGLIVPSKYYGILAAGRPAIFIGDPDGELAREIRATNTGLAISVGDSAALAQGLRRLAGEPGYLAQLCANARQQAQERHSSQRALKAWQTMLSELDPGPAAQMTLTLLPEVQSGT